MAKENYEKLIDVIYSIAEQGLDKNDIFYQSKKSGRFQALLDILISRIDTRHPETTQDFIDIFSEHLKS